MDEKGLLEHKPDYLVCTCMCVMYSDIVDAIEHGAKTFDDLQEKLFVGTGCSSCVQEVHAIVKERTQNDFGNQ